LLLLGFLLRLALCGGTAAQEMALTFDDLPDHGPLPAGVTRSDVARSILATLKAAAIPPVYGFINAGKLEKHPEEIEVLNLWRAAGQPLASHTYSHMNFNENTASAFEDDIRKNETTLRQLMGENNWHWFRYPYLWEGDTLEKRREIRAYLGQSGYRIAQVTMDFEDYAWNAPYARCRDKNDEKSMAWLKQSYLDTALAYLALDQEMAQRIFHRDIKHVLLLHIGAFDALMLPDLLAQLKQRGFKFISLEEAQADPAYRIDPDAALRYGGTLLDQIFDSQHLAYPPHTEKPMKQLQETCQ
jgi:peptidoglycan-N-acetylglucosamine deacetylase